MVLDAFVEKKWDNLHDLDPETFRAKIGELSFSQIALNPELPLRDDLTWTFSSPEHPLVYGDVVIMGSFIGFNEEYYKNAVSIALLFREADKIVRKQTWYRSYKANIVAYALAKIFYTVDMQYPELAINLKAIWQKQTLSMAWVKLALT